MQQSEPIFKSKYQKIEKIGEGAYGCVYKARHIQEKYIVALKVMEIDELDEGISSTTMREISILRSLDHTNIIRLLDIEYGNYRRDNKITLVFEYMQEDLCKHIRQNKKTLNSLTIKNYFHQILKGVEYLHNNRIFHRDLKPQNILINQFGHIKIADFGLGRVFNFPYRTLSKQIETLWYRAPQLLLGSQKYDLGVDMWSLGCVFYELAQNGSILFRSESEIELIFNIFKYHGTPKLDDWPDLKKYPYFMPTFPKFHAEKANFKYKNLEEDGIDLLNRLIAIKPNERISVQKALNHYYFRDIIA